MATTAIAILNYNGKDFLEKFLPSVIQYSNNTPIYVGDNASTDGSVELIKSKFPTIHLIELLENFGYSKGYNQLLKSIDTDYIALINSDIEVTANWLLPLTTELDNNESVAAIQPKIKSYRAKDYFEYAGAAGGFIDAYGYPYCRGRIFDTIEKDHGQYDNSIDITWASGACFIVRKAAFDLVSGFDDDFFAHMEEIDLCWRLANQGFTIRYNAESTVYHVGGGTLAYESPFKSYLNYRNGLYLLIKNLPSKKIKAVITTRLLLDWVSGFHLLLKKKWKLFLSVFKAHKKVFSTRKVFYAKRKELNKTVLEDFSVVIKYFVRRKKRFTDL